MNYKQVSMSDIWISVRLNVAVGSKDSNTIIQVLARQNPKILLLQQISKALSDLPTLRRLVAKIPKTS